MTASNARKATSSVVLPGVRSSAMSLRHNSIHRGWVVLWVSAESCYFLIAMFSRSRAGGSAKYGAIRSMSARPFAEPWPERPAAQRQEREKWFTSVEGPIAYRCPACVQGYWLQ